MVSISRYSRISINKSIICLVSLLALTACNQEKYPKVRKAFMEYVQENFDDPHNLKEIVSISPSDTVSTLFFINKSEEVMLLGDAARALGDTCRAKLERLQNVSSSDRVKIPENVKEVLQSELLSIMSMAYKEYGASRNESACRVALNDAIDNTERKQPLYEFTIKYRTADKDGSMTMNEAYAYIDSLTNMTEVYPDKIAIDDYSHSLYDLTIAVSKYVDAASALSDITIKEKESIDRIVSIVEQYR